MEYTDKKGRKKTKNDESVAPVHQQNIKRFDYLDQYCKVKLALIVESIFISKTVTSIQMKAHEVYVKPLKPREKILFIEDSDDENSENEEVIDLQQTLQSISDTEG